MKRHPTEWEKILNHMSDKGLIPKYIKNSYNLIAKNQTIQLKNGPRIWVDIFFIEDYTWPIGICKGAQRH